MRTSEDLEGVLTKSPSDLQQYGLAKAKEIQDRRERRKLELEKAAGDNKLKVQYAPKLWEDLRETIEQRVNAINNALSERALMCDTDRLNLVIIHVKHVPAILSASYDQPTGRVTLSLDDHSERYDVEVSKGEVKYKAVGYFSASQVAKMLVDKAAGMVL